MTGKSSNGLPNYQAPKHITRKSGICSGTKWIKARRGREGFARAALTYRNSVLPSGPLGMLCIKNRQPKIVPPTEAALREHDADPYWLPPYDAAGRVASVRRQDQGEVLGDPN
jgi:hypothetical protein